MGMSVGSFIKKYKLKKASEDLLGSSDNIIDIAIKYGFNSNEVFSRAFKKEYGITPSKFRKTQGFGENNELLVLPDFSSLKQELLSTNGSVRNCNNLIMLKDRIFVGIERKSNDALVHTILPTIEYFIKVSDQINHTIDNTFYRLCYDLNLENEIPSFKELIAIEVSSIDDIPEGMIFKRIDEMKMIEFTHQGRLFKDDECSVLNTYHMIYRYRIPALGYELSNDLFIEKYDSRFKGPFSDRSEFSIMMSIY
jgi:AraC family transcriptional regulator